MSNFNIRRSPRRSSVSGRDFEPGEAYISALTEENEEFERSDYSLDEWQESAPRNCLAWWRCQVPENDQARVYWAPKHVLLAYLDELLQSPRGADIAYVMALALIRRRVLKHVDDTSDPNAQAMRLQTSDGREFVVPIAHPSPDQIDKIQQKLEEHLFTDQPPELE